MKKLNFCKNIFTVIVISFILASCGSNRSGSGAGGGSGNSGGSGAGTNKITLSPTERTVNEDVPKVNFILSLDEAANKLLTIKYRTEGDTAMAGEDYFDANGTATIDIGKTSTIFSVDIIQDKKIETTEQFSIILSDLKVYVKQADGRLILDTSNREFSLPVKQAKVIIEDNSKIVLFVKAGQVEELERDTGETSKLIFEIGIENEILALNDINLDFSTATDDDANMMAHVGVDYEAVVNRKITIPENSNVVTTDVTIIGDNMLEGEERFRAIINNLVTDTPSSLVSFAGGNSSNETVAIISDNDRLTFRVAVENNQIEGDRTVDVGLIVDNNGIEGSFGLSQVRIRYEATLDKRSEIAGGYVRAKAGDFEATSGVIVFDSMSMADASMDFSFKLRGDEILEADETLLLRLTSIDGASRILGLDDSDATVIIIQNDERATLTIADASHNESSPFEFTIESDIEIAGDVTIDIRANITSRDTSSDDFNLIPLYHLAKGNRTTVKIPVVNDNLVEMNERFMISLDSTSSQVDTSNDIINTDTALGTIINDDKAIFRLNSPGNVTEADRDATSRLPFTINTTSSIAPNVTIPITVMTTAVGTATKDSDFVDKSETIDFSSSITGSMFVVTVSGDNLVELTETLEVSARIDSVQTGVLASFENNRNTATARAMILDNDLAVVSLGYAGSSMITEPATSSDSVPFNFRISTTNPISVPVKLTYIIGEEEAERTALEEQDYRTPTGNFASGNLTLAANTTAVDLPITIIGDEGFEQSERLTVTLMGLIIDSQFREKVSLSNQNVRRTAIIDNDSLNDSASTLTIRPYTQTIDEGVIVKFYVDIARNPAMSNVAFNYQYEIDAVSGINNDDFIDATIDNKVSRTIPANSNRSVINIMTYDDNEVEFAEKFRVLIFDTDNVGVEVAANTANVTMNDNDLAELANVTSRPRGRSITFDFNYTIKYLQPDRVTIAYQTGETAPANCQLGSIANVDGTPASYRVGGLESGQQYSFRFCVGDNNGFTEGLVRSAATIPDFDEDGILDANDVDDNNNGLIEIRTVEEFNNIRHNLAGSGYNTGNGVNNTTTRTFPISVNCSANRHRFLDEKVFNVFYGNALCGYELMNNIDLSSDANFLPIGMAGGVITEDASFTGIFDGNGYTISNLTINRPNNSKVGLFAKLDKAIVKNVNFENVAITAKSEVGTVAGTSAQGYFENIRLKNGSVTANNGARIGGLVGVFQNHEEEARHYSNYRYFYGDVDYKLSNGARNVHNRLNITANYTGSGIREGVGGLVGASQASYIIHSSSNATINVSANISDVGGLVGSLTVNTALDNDRATGSSWYTIPINSSITVGIKTPKYVERSIVRQSFSAGSIITPANEALVVGGLVGRNTKHGKITNSFSAVNITGTIGSRTNSAVPTKAIGGLIGYNNGYVGSTYATGSITNTDVANVGGLIGFSNNIDIYSRNFKVDSKTGNHGSNYDSHNWITTITLDHLEGLRGDNGDDGKDWKTFGYANWFHFGYTSHNDPYHSQIWDRASLSCNNSRIYYNNQTIWVMRGTKSFPNGWSNPSGNDNTTSQVDAPTTDENGNSAAYYQMPALRCMGTTDAERKANIDYQRRLFRR